MFFIISGDYMNYKTFLTKLTCTDAVLDTVENKDAVEVSCNKIEGVPVLFFKENDTVIDCIVLR